ncbi:P-loop containing nucleoside triphosphate hydrolase protein [Ampelomyces quisqualis]|uniref:P-loop containing nucleoside triphosphate hydrolase protein n=1 Tax=Ampelomyces quisqualis TaxID=50730 RepID=A0A6A5Q8H4_AMPQU|nr:P-loop containing nucleoside triphosphate hydrolase protein [Ampelomyces quisqualis]
MNSAAAARQNVRNSYHAEDDDGASRLSEGMEPMHITPQPQPLISQLQRAANEIDALGVHVNHAILTIHRLEGLGLQKLKIPLPKIVVLGEQSTGKSSVIEAITGIKTPRATGTCTRCPLFIKLESTSSSSEWEARVTLRRDFTFDGKSGRGPERRFPGWLQAEQPHTVDFMSTNDPDMLEAIIARAQMATVSPLIDYREFAKASLTENTKAHCVAFSPNIVCISIRYLGLPALSLYDLPGMIGQSEEPQDIKFVKDLVTDYVNDPEALVLVTCSMENDIANSTAGGLARRLKATDRCIGVLTKPDRLLPSSCQDILRDVFETKRFPYGHGYFVVRNLGQEQLDSLTHNDARVQERKFFEQNEPFAVAYQKYSSRFGTWNLQAALSGKLAEQITRKLPVIDDEIKARLGEVEDELKQYPAPPTHNATRIIFDLVLQFTQQLRGQLEGDFDHDDWRNIWQALQKAFFDSLLTLKPTMSTFGRRDNGLYRESLEAARLVNEIINLDDDDDEVDPRGDTQMKDAPETPTKKRKTEGTPVSSPLKASHPADTSLTAADTYTGDFSNNRIKFQLDEVKKHLATKSSTRIPGHLDTKAINAMMMATLRNWQLPLDKFFDKLGHLIKSHVKNIFHECFGSWAGTTLYDKAWAIVLKMLELNLTLQRTTMAAESLVDEQNGVYIFHDELYTRDKEAMLEHYRQARLKARLNVYKRERFAVTEKPLTPGDEAKILKDAKLMVLLKREPYNTELAAAAEVTTYYLMAARRFHDSICMRVESKFLKQLRTQLRDELENGLGIHDGIEGHRNAVRLLAEDPQREEQRQVLLAQRAALIKGQQILRDLKQRRYGHDDLAQTSTSDTVNGLDQAGSGMATPLSEDMNEI